MPPPAQTCRHPAHPGGGIVFLAAAENFNHAIQLGITAEHRVEPPLLCEARQVAAVFIAGAARAGGSHPRLGGQHKLTGKLAAFPRGLRQLDAQSRQPPAGRAGRVLEDGAEQVLVLRPGGTGRVRTQHGKLHGLAQLGGKVPAVQAARTARRVGGGMLGQGGGCHPLAAQKIRCCPLCCLHQRQQQMAGIRLAAPLLPRQHQRRVHGACRREGKTFISVDPEHLQILL